MTKRKEYFERFPTEKVFARVIDARKKKGKFPWVPLHLLRHIANVEFYRNRMQQEGKRQPAWRGLITFEYLEPGEELILKRGDELSIDLWEYPGPLGNDGEVRLETT